MRIPPSLFAAALVACSLDSSTKPSRPTDVADEGRGESWVVDQADKGRSRFDEEPQGPAAGAPAAEEPTPPPADQGAAMNPPAGGSPSPSESPASPSEQEPAEPDPALPAEQEPSPPALPDLEVIWSTAHTDNGFVSASGGFEGPSKSFTATFALEVSTSASKPFDCLTRIEAGPYAAGEPAEKTIMLTPQQSSCFRVHRDCSELASVRWLGCGGSGLAVCARSAGGFDMEVLPACAGVDFSEYDIVALRHVVDRIDYQRTADAPINSGSFDSLATSERWELLGRPR